MIRLSPVPFAVVLPRLCPSVVSLKFVEEVQTMAAAEVELKSPCSPLSKGDSSPWTRNPLFEKKGRFSEECRGNYAANFWYGTLVWEPEYGDSLNSPVNFVLRVPSEMLVARNQEDALNRRIEVHYATSYLLNLIEPVSADGGMSHIFRIAVSLSGDFHTGRRELTVR